jgi:pectate lyase
MNIFAKSIPTLTDYQDPTFDLKKNIRKCTSFGDSSSGIYVKNGRVVDSNLIREIPGYAKNANIKGGLGGKILVVTNLRDYDPNEKNSYINGSLRAIIDIASSIREPSWVIFDKSLDGGVINLVEPLRLPSNITLDGGCSSVTILSPDHIGQLYIFDVQNVIISNINFRMFPGEINKSGQTCIRVNGDIDAIAIVNNEISNCGDGAIDITISPNKLISKKGRLTIAHNLIYNHDKVMLFGTFSCKIRPDKCTEIDTLDNQLRSPYLYLTLYGNLFYRTGQRHPRVFGGVMLHAINNIIIFEKRPQRGGGLGSTYGIFVSNGARALIENNIFIPLNFDGRPARVIWTTNTPGADQMKDDSTGFIKQRDNIVIGQGVNEDSKPWIVNYPNYYEPLKKLVFDSKAISDAIECVRSRAGVYGNLNWQNRNCN